MTMPNKYGMSRDGDNIVAAICTDKFATIANIGDSRCYLLNESGFKQVTEDHSLVNELVRLDKFQRKMLKIIREKMFYYEH